MNTKNKIFAITRRYNCDSSEPEYRRQNRDQQKDQSIVEHFVLLSQSGRFE